MSNDNLKERLTDMSVLASTRTTADALKYIEELEERLKAATDDAKEAEAYAGELEAVLESIKAKLAKALGLLEAWIGLAAHCTIEEGVCCCGDNMDTHANPMDCGHSPVDHGAYIAKSLAEETNATLAELTGGKDE